MKIGFGQSSYFFAGSYLNTLKDFALENGVPLAEIVKGSGLSEKVFLLPPHKLEGTQYFKVWTNLVAAVPGDKIKTLLAMRDFTVSKNTHGALGLAVRSAKNLSSAIEVMTQYSKTRTNYFAFSQSQSDEYVEIQVDYFDPIPVVELTPQDDQFLFYLSSLLGVEGMVRDIVQDRHKLMKTVLNLPFKRPENFSDFPFGPSTTLCFDQPCFSIQLPVSWLEAPLFSSSEELHEAALERCELELMGYTNQNFVREIHQRLQENKEAPKSIGEMASLMNVSTSTLQRRLRGAGTTYKELKAEDRLFKAKKLLQSSDLSMELIAIQLGYHNASNFTKWFKQALGVTPSRFRSEAKLGEASLAEAV